MIKNITEKSFLNAEYLKSILKSGKWCEHGATLDQFIEDNENNFPFDISSMDTKQILKNEDFKQFLIIWLPVRFRYVMEWLEKDLEACKEGHLYSIKRTIFCNRGTLETAIKESFDIGRFWSTYNPQAYCAKKEKEKNIEMTVTGLVCDDSINWIETIRSRMDYSNGDCEAEIYIKSGSFPVFKKVSWIENDEFFEKTL